MQIVSDILGQPLQVAAVSVGAAYGDALMAALGTGRFTDFSQLQSVLSVERVYQPDQERHRAYQPYYEMYQELYLQTKELMHRL